MILVLVATNSEGLDRLIAHLPRGVAWKHPEAGVALWIPAPGALDVAALHAEAQRLGVAFSPSALYEVGGVRGVEIVA